MARPRPCRPGFRLSRMDPSLRFLIWSMHNKKPIPPGRSASLAHSPRGDLVIRNARLFDPRDLSVTPATSVVVSGERIVRIGPDSDIKPSANAEIIDAKGRFLM